MRFERKTAEQCIADETNEWGSPCSAFIHSDWCPSCHGEDIRPAVDA